MHSQYRFSVVFYTHQTSPLLIFLASSSLSKCNKNVEIKCECFKSILSLEFKKGIGYNDLHASDGRDTEALNCKPITNL